MSTQANPVIMEAVREMRLLSFVYHGKPRIVEPHTYGIDSTGRATLVAVQVGGEASEALPCWRSFREAEMRAPRVLEERFARPREGYRRDDGAFRTIHAQLRGMTSG